MQRCFWIFVLSVVISSLLVSSAGAITRMVLGEMFTDVG